MAVERSRDKDPQDQEASHDYTENLVSNTHTHSGWGDGSLGKVLVTLAEGPESDAHHQLKS